MGDIQDTEGAEVSYLPNFLKKDATFGDPENDNGLILSNTYIPEEVLLHILSFLEPRTILKCSLVCKEWNRLIRSYSLWATIYRRRCNRKPKKLPWYLYYCYLSTNFFDVNLLKNGNGEQQLENWTVVEEGGNKFLVEDPPVGADPLNLDVSEFNNKTSCFATSYSRCYKIQNIKLGKSNLFRYILSNYKPHIFLSEWTAGRFDCGCVYRLKCGFSGLSPTVKCVKPASGHIVKQWEGSKWVKIAMVIKDYPEGVEGLRFEHEGRDTQFWAGHYGSKMAGGVIKLLFDSIEPLPETINGRKIVKRHTKMKFEHNGTDTNNFFAEFNREYVTIAQCCRLPRYQPGSRA
ncbi:hypothetical protein FQA39_LY12722 [Lamprigera yunnana]|nr:hypothetical protein FQA39_LY12722 [Lamprigera yunnana]